MICAMPRPALFALLRHPSCVQIEKDEDGEEVVLGHGQFGQVVKGCYRLAPVAVKRLNNQTASERAAFIKEMAILRACRGSRYIVPFVGASLQKVILRPVELLRAVSALLWALPTQEGSSGVPGCALAREDRTARVHCPTQLE